MRTENGHVHLDEEEASGGSKEGVVRWVLAGGLLLAILLLSVTWIVPALLKERGAGTGVASERTQAKERAVPATDAGNDTEATQTDRTNMQDGLEVEEN